MKNQQMSLWGIGPMFVIPSVILSFGSIIIDHYIYMPFVMTGILKNVFIIIGTICVILGAYLWLSSAFEIRKCIRKEQLYQDGVYSIVRHPIYSGIWFVLSGVLLLFHSYILVLIPIITFIYLTFLVKKEEKVLFEHFGDEYLKYKKRVNAIIPTLCK